MSFIELILNTEYRSSIALTSRDFYAPILKNASRETLINSCISL